MRISIAKLVHAYDMQLARDPGDWVGQARMEMLWKKGPLMVRMQPRSRFVAEVGPAMEKEKEKETGLI